MRAWRIGWGRIGVIAIAIGLLSSCLLTSNFDGLTGGIVAVDGGPDTGSGGASSSMSASAASAGGGASSSSSSSTVASSSSGIGAGFPSTPVLDDFNRSDGPIGGQWLVENPAQYSISNDRLAISTGQPGVIVWPDQFGPTQEAFVTFQASDPGDGELELIMKSQGGVIQECESIQVDYVYPNLNGVVCAGGNFVEIGKVAAMFAPGDQLGARFYADGKLEAYRNGVLIATWDATGWPFYKNGGRIGFASYGIVKTALLDDFGGG